MLVEEAEPVGPAVLDLLSDDVAGFDSALPPSFDVLFGVSTFVDESFVADSFAAGSFDADSALVAFFRAAEG